MLFKKKIITPLQKWLLSQGRCVACGRLLSKGEWEERADKTAKIICRCGRVFIYQSDTKKYRRALFSEV